MGTVITIIMILLMIALIVLDCFLLVKIYEKPKEQPKVTKPRLTKEEKDKQERIKKSFDNLMNYDESVARRIRK